MASAADIEPEQRLSWADLESIVSENDLEALFRTPSELAKYQKCKQEFERGYGGTAQYILKKRLAWVDEQDPARDTPTLLSKVKPTSMQFLQDAHDVKILANDFPYAVEIGVQHVVVWSKTPSPKRADGYISDQAREIIANYVEKTFQGLLGMDSKDILWFRNTTALQSVSALEHFHVLLRKPTQEDLDKLIGTAGYLDSKFKDLNLKSS